ncbi:MAG TPA: sensor histidine kinase [Chitinophagaceae bacterium]|nr:sensor histidine kinase [Chitinophagaceae bacterium]
MRKFYCLILLVLSWMTCLTQPNVVDSLQQIINNLPDDTVKVNRMNDLVVKLQFADPVRAAAMAKEAISLSQKINYSLGQATAYRLTGVLLVDKMEMDSGKVFYDRAMKLVKGRTEKAFQKQEGLLTHSYGTICHKKQLYDSATFYYTEAIRILHACGEEGMVFFPYNNLATIYGYFKDNDKALYYARKAHGAALYMKEPNRIISSVNSVMSVLIDLKKFDSVLLPLKENLVKAEEVQNIYQLGITNNLLASYYGYGLKKFDSSVYYDKKALAYMRQISNEYEVANMLHNTGYYYGEKGDYDSARHYLQLAIRKGEELDLEQVIQYSLTNLVEIEEKTGNKAAAFDYLKRLVGINDSLQARYNRDKVNELEAKFQAERKDKQIALQQASLQKRKTFNYILMGGIAAVLLISLLGYRNYRQKQHLQARRISELEAEKKLMATEAVLKGEEQERTRLAKDLHDGLGGMLSGIKHSFNTMKGNLIMTPENHQAFERSMDMLDSSIKEMRRVAHNMMPEALVKFGLDTALRDFCNDINQSGAIKVSYQSIGMQNASIDQTTSIAVYRIVQELINNTIKHAGAGNSIVQLSRQGGQLSITVEDDGRGFDTSILRQSHGIGWSNIQHRVDFLKGKLDIDSQPGQGTSVHIELNEP